MLIKGLQKLTLLDFPGRIACTVFTGGCNLRCPFCHNALLVTEIDNETIEEKDFFEFLKDRKGRLDGVAVTGGEPLLQKDAEDFLAKIKELGFAIKLDTNGTFPDRLKKNNRPKISRLYRDRYKKFPQKVCINSRTFRIGRQ